MYIDERKQQALDNLRNALARCVQDGLHVEIYKGADTTKTPCWLAVYVDEVNVENILPGLAKEFSNQVLRYSPKE